MSASVRLSHIFLITFCWNSRKRAQGTNVSEPWGWLLAVRGDSALLWPWVWCRKEETVRTTRRVQSGRGCWHALRRLPLCGVFHGVRGGRSWNEELTHISRIILTSRIRAALKIYKIKQKISLRGSLNWEHCVRINIRPSCSLSAVTSIHILWNARTCFPAVIRNPKHTQPAPGSRTWESDPSSVKWRTPYVSCPLNRLTAPK